MKLSIIIVSYNTKKLTFQTIESILFQKNDPTTEIIVVDNDSKDGSVELLERLQEKGKIRLIKNDHNTGFAVANNQAIKISNGEYILLLNSDTIVKNDSLKRLINFAEKTPNAGVVVPRLLNKDGSIQLSCRLFPTIKRAILEYWFGKTGYYEWFAPEGGKPVEVEAASGAAFLITPKSKKIIGGLDERFFFYFEDLDYCRRVHEAGLKVYYYPDAEIVHLVGSSGKKITDPLNQWRRLIPSSKLYHGLFKYYILYAVMLLGQKWQKIFQKQH